MSSETPILHDKEHKTSQGDSNKQDELNLNKAEENSRTRISHKCRTDLSSRSSDHESKGCECSKKNSNSKGSRSNKVIMNLSSEQIARSETCSSHSPWFGLDIGGSLVKVVIFDPKEISKEEENIFTKIRLYLKSSKAYGLTGRRDEQLEMSNCLINGREGTLHFIRFSTSQMPGFIQMTKEKGLANLLKEFCATGGGAYKFEEEIKSNLGITLRKTDELDSVIYGIHYIDKYNAAQECYYIQDPLDDNCKKISYDFSEPYPYLVVNIGSGVSILAVYSPTSYSRIWGSSIGGGTFEGLCCSLTQTQVTFDEAIRMAEAGSSTKVDKLVKDIYGGDYTKFNLKGDLVASSFGIMNNPERRSLAKPEDFARGVLELITLNIASIARLCASIEEVDRVVFIGNFLRVNELSLKLLSYALDYWSKGEMKALFLEHEGYFGAVGCLVESTQGLNKSDI